VYTRIRRVEEAVAAASELLGENESRRRLHLGLCSLSFFLSFFYALIHYSNIHTDRHTRTQPMQHCTDKERKKEKRGAIMNSGGAAAAAAAAAAERERKRDEEAQ